MPISFSSLTFVSRDSFVRFDECLTQTKEQSGNKFMAKILVAMFYGVVRTSIAMGAKNSAI